MGKDTSESADLFLKNLETCSCVVVGVPSLFFKGCPKQICLEGVMISCWYLSSIL